MPAGTGQREKFPLASGVVCILTCTTPALSRCSSATMALPPTIGCPVVLSISLPVIELAVGDTSPACSTGFSRNVPVPVVTIEAHPSKSIFRSFVWPEAMVNCPPAICPEGILMPVCEALPTSRARGLAGSAASTTQLAPALPHWLLLRLAALLASIIRICWYVPGCSDTDPRSARKHWLPASPSRSTCRGELLS